jgi:hypothetical protein
MDMLDFLQKEYELKVRYLTDHFSRMWMRFNFFLGIHSALFALSLNNDYSMYAWLVCAVGLTLALAWYYFGSTDNYLVDAYRGQAGHAYRLLRKKLAAELVEFSANEQTALTFAGSVPKMRYDPEHDTLAPIKQGFFQRRYDRISATELAVVFPVLFLLIWAVRFGVWFFVPTA